MSKKYDSRCDERHRLVFNTYLDVLKQHGKYAAIISKTEIYKQVAEIVFLSPHRVGMIIREQFKQLSNNGTGRYERHSIDDLANLEIEYENE
jgi:hypothetical protein